VGLPPTFGTSGHLVGGTFLAMVLGTYAAILGMTIVLLMQALFSRMEECSLQEQTFLTWQL